MKPIVKLMTFPKAKRLSFFESTPKDVYIAFSGGMDSSVLLHSLIAKRNKNITLIWVNHNTPFRKVEEEFVKKVAERYKLPVITFRIPEYPGYGSLEHYWSVERNSIFQRMDKTVLTGHHLNDAVETYVMSTFTGTSKLLNYRNGNILRPMICVPKTDIVYRAKRFNLEYLEDPTNNDLEFNLRNKVRHQLYPELMKVFPGIETTVRRMIRTKEQRHNLC